MWIDQDVTMPPFNYQAVSRGFSNKKELHKQYYGKSFFLNDLSILDSFLIYIQAFHRMNLLEGKINEKEVRQAKDFLGLDLSPYLNNTEKLELLVESYFDTGFTNALNRKINFEELVPDYYFVFRTHPDAMIKRAEERNRAKELGETDILYATNIYDMATLLLDCLKNKDWDSMSVFGFNDEQIERLGKALGRIKGVYDMDTSNETEEETFRNFDESFTSIIKQL